MPSETTAAPSRVTAPSRKIAGREIHGNQVTDRLECGHTVTTRYTGYQVSRKCAHALEADRG